MGLKERTGSRVFVFRSVSYIAQEVPHAQARPLSRRGHHRAVPEDGDRQPGVRDGAVEMLVGNDRQAPRDRTTAAAPAVTRLTRIRGLRWYIGGLLFASTVINYIDR